MSTFIAPVIGFALAAAFAWWMTRPATVRAEPTMLQSVGNGIWTGIWKFLTFIQIVIFFLVTSAVGAVLITMIIGPEMVDPVVRAAINGLTGAIAWLADPISDTWFYRAIAEVWSCLAIPEWLVVRVTKPWAGWWLPQALGGIMALPLIAAKVMWWKWAVADKTTKGATKNLHGGIDTVIYLTITVLVFAVACDVIAFLTALVREINNMIS